MDARRVTEEETEFGAQQVQLASVTRDDQVRPAVRLDRFGDRKAACRAVELVPAQTRVRGWKGRLEQGWHWRRRGSLPFATPPANRPSRSSDGGWRRPPASQRGAPRGTSA